MMKTYVAKPGEFEQKWHLIDARGQVLGRLASEVANILRGKNKPIFTPHVDTGDYVVIVNVADIRLTGNKLKDKVYYHHTGYPGGIKSITAEELMEKNPTELINSAVKGMLPKNKLSRQIIKKLKIYAGSEHQHEAQCPVAREI
ncbi:MAG: 50S ribosomal protein L13 [Deltaproteobacteria bacterium]|nr:50S ribosomal protein L13 [Candidatus Tharpella aukensis]